VYEKINLCQPQYNKFINQTLRDLLGKIFVPDPELRISLEEMKEHKVFKVSHFIFYHQLVAKISSSFFTLAGLRFYSSHAREIPKQHGTVYPEGGNVQ